MKNRKVKNKHLPLCTLILYVLTWTPNATKAGSESNYNIELYQNMDGDECLFPKDDTAFRYLIRGRVTIDINLRSVGFQKKTVACNSFDSYDNACDIKFSDSCNAPPSRDCYCTSTKDPNVYDIVWNTTLKEEDSNGKVRALMLIYNREKITSNELNLPYIYNPGVDKLNLELQINEQPVNADKCQQTLASDTLKMQYYLLCSKGFPVTISILDENYITELKENVIETYILRDYEKKKVINITLRVEVCNRFLRNLICTFKNALPTSNDEYAIVAILVGVSSIVILVVVGVVIAYCIKSGKWIPKRTITDNCNDRVNNNYVAVSQTSTVRTQLIHLQHSGALNIFKEYHGIEQKDEALKKYNILLIGKNGNGKSATGNTILGRNVFTSTANPTQFKQVIKKCSTTNAERSIQVVDGPSTSGNVKKYLHTMIKQFKETLALVPEGFDALLLIFRFGSRYTYEDDQSLILLKLILGEHFVSNRCIIVITGGDSFEHETKEDSILNWCMKTDGPFRNLVEECEYRVVLFDNKNGNEAKQSDQIQNLLNMIDTINLKMRTNESKM